MFGDELFPGLEAGPQPTPPAQPGPAEQPPAAQRQRALYLRWRPRGFDDVVGQEHVTRTLRNAATAGRLAHAYLLTGPRGTGKTSVARILFRAANCPRAVDGDPCNACPLCVAALEGRALDLVEIDAASNRGIDDIRDLREKVAYRPSEARYRVYIIDEAHELTGPAWDAFLKTLEEPPAHALFVLATTEAHRVPATIVSRCQRFDFRRGSFEATRALLARVAAAERLEVEPAVLDRLARAARGGLRDALSLLDQLSAYSGARVDMGVARAVLGLPAVEATRGVLEALGRRDAGRVIGQLAEIAEGGVDLRQFVEELAGSLRALLLLRAGAAAPLAAEFAADELAWLRERAAGWSVGALSGLIRELSTALARTRDAEQFQLQVELALLGVCELAGGQGEPEPAPAAPPEPATAAPPEPEPLAADGGLRVARERWSRVVEHVQGARPAPPLWLSSAQPVAIEEGVLVVAFGNKPAYAQADKAANRQAIEEGVRRALGRAYRVRCTLGGPGGDGPSLLDDPVISYAARTFGGRPRPLP